MIVDLRRAVATAVMEAVEAITGESIPAPPVEDPPHPEFGDLAVPAALELGRKLNRPPRQLAEELLAYLQQHPVDGVRSWKIAGPGYLNIFLDRGYLLDRLVARLSEPAAAPAGAKVVVEHTSINPNKAAHIGHLRNACLGDTLVRVLRYQGVPVEVHNYIDDTGVQVADVVLGFIDLRGSDAAAVRSLPDPFDYTCWDLYTEITGRLEADEELMARRRQVLLALEQGREPEAGLASVVVERITRCHLATMARLGIEYDLLVREGDIVALDLWSEAFDKLKAGDLVYYAEEGKHAGCWMMRLKGVSGFEELEEADKVLVRSNGTATYVAKDIAYHMWRYGMLGRTFYYRPFAEGIDGHITWESTRGEGQEMPFGQAHRGVSVIDVRQGYLQAIVALAVATPGDSCEIERHTHFDYEMVALTPRTAQALGIPLAPADHQRAFVEMSGRRGYGVKADDLLDVLEKRAGEEVAIRNPELTDLQRGVLAEQIAAAAVRYFLVKFGRNTVIAFDLDEALNFEGETGPYLQYAAVRANGIFEKMRQRWGVSAQAAIHEIRGDEALEPATASAPEERLSHLGIDLLRQMLHESGNEGLWSLLLSLAQFEKVVAQAAQSLELSGLAKYAFRLAQEFNRFYHSYPILQEEDRSARSLRALVAYLFRARLGQTLGLLGIPVPDRM